MKNGKILYLAPRILSIVFILFISLFALDVFSMEGTLVEKIGGFLIHLIPTYFLIAILLIAWKKERLGGFLFIFLFILFAFVFGNWRSTTLLLFSPLLLIAILFWLSTLSADKKHL